MAEEFYCGGKYPGQEADLACDLNNLLPVVGEVNGDRSNLRYGMWSNHPGLIDGQCQSVPDFKGKRGIWSRVTPHSGAGDHPADWM